MSETNKKEKNKVINLQIPVSEREYIIIREFMSWYGCCSYKQLLNFLLDNSIEYIYPANAAFQISLEKIVAKLECFSNALSGMDERKELLRTIKEIKQLLKAIDLMSVRKDQGISISISGEPDYVLNKLEKLGLAEVDDCLDAMPEYYLNLNGSKK